jgi:hypothetical protein
VVNWVHQDSMLTFIIKTSQYRKQEDLCDCFAISLDSSVSLA